MEHELHFRKPTKSDLKEIYTLVCKSQVLDVNSEYLYLLQTTHFKNSCCVAVENSKVVGFVSGYIIPDKPNTLFIWQVVVHEKQRGKNLACQIIENILQAKEMVAVEYINTTVSPSNKSSQRVFQKIAEKFNTNMKASILFEKEDFVHGHEEEVLFEIGPINKGIK
ncbi:MAG: diaminobutyrate acetyltransferase [Candidatus Marinarcus sp.]|uniref:diaminobutyrate acetyltransferase n=1 Tax=Candidatus Marinarcus sp. TaxID=3100987 RepID=UPI003B00B94B